VEGGTTVETGAPLREATFMVLLCLAPGPRHGYSILKEVLALSDGRVRLSTGTLYGALKRLLDRGWIERSDAEVGEETAAKRPGRPRRTYRLTALGHRMLDAEVARLRSLVAASDTVALEAWP
jgi:DNA-binding PadR family transcriptional regulator